VSSCPYAGEIRVAEAVAKPVLILIKKKFIVREPRPRPASILVFPVFPIKAVFMIPSAGQKSPANI
jgi:hypothetical protein